MLCNWFGVPRSKMSFPDVLFASPRHVRVFWCARLVVMRWCADTEMLARSACSLSLGSGARVFVAQELPLLRPARVHGWLQVTAMETGLGRHGSRQQQASEDRFVFPVRHGVLTQLDLLKYWKENKVFPVGLSTSCQNSSMNKWQNCTLDRSSLGAGLTVSAHEQTDYGGVKVEGPFQAWLLPLLSCKFPSTVLSLAVWMFRFTMDVKHRFSNRSSVLPFICDCYVQHWTYQRAIRMARCRWFEKDLGSEVVFWFVLAPKLVDHFDVPLDPGPRSDWPHVLIDVVFLLEPSASGRTTGITMDSGHDL